MATIFQVLLVSGHLLLVDLAMVGPLLCVWLEWTGSRNGAAWATQAARTLARASIWALVGGMLLGSLLLAARWWSADQAYVHAVENLPRSRLWFAGLEIVFSFACLGLYQRWLPREGKWRIAGRVLAVAAASNLMVHFPALFTILSLATTRPDLIDQPIDRAEFRQLLFDWEVVAREVHIWLSATVVGGVTLMAVPLLSRRDLFAKSWNDPSLAEKLVRRGALVALTAILLQFPVGIWVALALPEPAREGLLGGDLLACGMLVVGILLALHLAHRLAGLALAAATPAQIRSTAATLACLVLLMTGAKVRNEQVAATGVASAASQAPASIAGSSAATPARGR